MGNHCATHISQWMSDPIHFIHLETHTSQETSWHGCLFKGQEVPDIGL